MVLIQEMDLKLDLGFVYALLDVFTPENADATSSEQEVSHSHQVVLQREPNLPEDRLFSSSSSSSCRWSCF